MIRAVPVSRVDVTRRVRSSSRTRAGLRPFRAAPSRSTSDAWGLFLDGWTPPAAPTPASEAQALALPAFGRGVELLAAAVAGTALRAYRWDPALGVDVRLPEQPTILTDPYPLADPWQYRYAQVQDLILYGNHFALPGDPDSRTARPGWTVPLPVEDVWLLVAPDGASWSWVVAGSVYAPGELLHISAGARSGQVLGRGVLEQYGGPLGHVVAAEDHSGSYFAGGALPPAVLTSTQVVTPEQADALKARWRALTATREPLVMPAGYTLTPITSSAEQAQLVEARGLNVEQTARILGIPAHLLNLPGTSMTYQNLEQADISWVQTSVSRWADPIAAQITKWLLPAGTVARWDWTGSRLRADSKTTTDVLAAQVVAGIVTVDEARAVLGRPPLMSTLAPGSTPAGVPELTPQVIPS